MKYLFKPLVSLAIGIGKAARFLWNGENKVSQAQLILHPELIPIEKHRNGTVGSIILGVLSMSITLIAIFVGPSHNDIKHLEAKMQDSFNRMEMLDLLATPADSISNDSIIAYYQHQRGRLKMMATIIKQQNDFHKTILFPSDDNTTIIDVAHTALTTLKTYDQVQEYISSSLSEMAKLLPSHLDTTSFIWVDACYILQWYGLLNESKPLKNRLQKRIDKITNQVDHISKQSDIDKRKLGALCAEVVTSDDAIAYKLKTYEMIDLLYEYTIVKELYIVYGE